MSAQSVPHEPFGRNEPFPAARPNARRSAGDDASARVPGFRGLALVWFAVVGAAAIASALPFLARIDRGTDGWRTFAILAVAASAAQLFAVHTRPRNQAYQTAIVFLLAAAVLLPPELVALMGVVQYLPEWLKSRQLWFIQTFNIFNTTLNTLAAAGVFHLIQHLELDGAGVGAYALPGLGATLTFVALNHFVLSVMIRLAHGKPLRDTGLYSFDSLSIDAVLAIVGVATAAFWRTDPWLIPFAIAPLLLIQRALWVPHLEEEARVDAKTGLFNARHFTATFTDELARAQRFERPVSLILADLDLLRDINNTYGHLAGDAVLRGIAEIFRSHLRHYDIAARFGGEEFCILLPETEPAQALEIADRIRAAIADAEFEVETSSEPVKATISMGVAGFPRDGADANEILHEADLAVYRAKMHGRNRVFDASRGDESMPVSRPATLVAIPDDGPHRTQLPPKPVAVPDEERRRSRTRPRALRGPRLLSVSWSLGLFVGAVGVVGTVAGALALLSVASISGWTLVATIALVGVGQALAVEFEEGSISVSALGALAGAALVGPEAALPLAITIAAIDWSARRLSVHHALFNVGTLSLASLAAAGAFSIDPGVTGNGGRIAIGVLAGVLYFVVNTGLLSAVVALEGHARWQRLWRERFAWLLPHYVVYGLIAGVILVGYRAAGLWAYVAFAVPLLLVRKTQEAYLRHTQRSAQKLRDAAETIQSQNISLEHANKLLKERTTAAMESLSATVDARDAYTAGHSRRVQRLSLAIGHELGLSQAELDLLGQAALFHDIGKLAIPDAILLKPAKLSDEEWVLMQSHAEEGARIIERLGFLNDAVPAIRHHHERYDGRGYPAGIAGEDIPLNARIIHLADAIDSMLTVRIYRAARPLADALQEVTELAAKQFCPRCVEALERIHPLVDYPAAPAASQPALRAS